PAPSPLSLHDALPISLVAHLLLPFLGLALARAFGVDQRDVIRSGMVDAGEGSSRRAIPVVSRSSGAGSAGAAAAAGLLLAAICASAPILLPGLGLLLIVIAIAAPRGKIGRASCSEWNSDSALSVRHTSTRTTSNLSALADSA